MTPLPARRPVPSCCLGRFRQAVPFFAWLAQSLTTQNADLGLKCGGNPCPALTDPRGRIMKLLHSLKRFLVSDDGPTAVEYIVMVACIIILCITVFLAVR